MNISIDYDDTYTRDPSMWNRVIKLMRQGGHKVYIVTWRSESESTEVYLKLGDLVDGIYPTNRVAKLHYMFQQGVDINIWVDDNSASILYSYKGD